MVCLSLCRRSLTGKECRAHSCFMCVILPIYYDLACACMSIPNFLHPSQYAHITACVHISMHLSVLTLSPPAFFKRKLPANMQCFKRKISPSAFKQTNKTKTFYSSVMHFFSTLETIGKFYKKATY